MAETLPRRPEALSASDAVRGLWCASLSPIGPTGALDPALLTAHIQGLLTNAVDGVVLFGTTGEGPSFSVAERCQGLETVLAAGIAPRLLVAATGCAALSDTVALTRHALQSGCPRCLILPPFFWKQLPDRAVFRYYASLIEQLADDRLRLYLYHFPQMSGVPIRPDVVARLADGFPGVVAGIKDSAGDFTNTASLLERIPQLSILVGHEPDIPKLMRAGGAGTICGLANVFPKRVAALMSPSVTADDEIRVRNLLDALASFPFVPAFKALRAAQTGVDGWRAVRPPLLPLSPVEGSRLAELPPQDA